MFQLRIKAVKKIFRFNPSRFNATFCRADFRPIFSTTCYPPLAAEIVLKVSLAVSGRKKAGAITNAVGLIIRVMDSDTIGRFFLGCG